MEYITELRDTKKYKVIKTIKVRGITTKFRSSPILNNKGGSLRDVDFASGNIVMRILEKEFINKGNDKFMIDLFDTKKKIVVADFGTHVTAKGAEKLGRNIVNIIESKTV